MVLYSLILGGSVGCWLSRKLKATMQVAVAVCKMMMMMTMTRRRRRRREEEEEAAHAFIPGKRLSFGARTQCKQPADHARTRIFDPRSPESGASYISLSSER